MWRSVGGFTLFPAKPRNVPDGFMDLCFRAGCILSEDYLISPRRRIHPASSAPRSFVDASFNKVKQT